MDQKTLLHSVATIRRLAQESQEVHDALQIVLRAEGCKLSEWVASKPEAVFEFAEQAALIAADDDPIEEIEKVRWDS